MLTNNHNLPEFLAKAVDGFSSKYTRGKADYSVTGLIQPPYMSRLKRDHAGEITEDITDRLYAIQGQAIHKIIEAAELDASIAEERLNTDVAGKIVSGAPDVYYKKAIYDIKTCSTYAREIKPEWEAQLNMYAYLFRETGFKVESIAILALYRDWSKRKAKYSPDYPQAGAEVIEYPLWENDKTLAYMQERVELHERARELPLDQVPICTPTERWAKPEKWAVMKKGAKRAVKLCDTQDEAMCRVAENAALFVEHRPGEDIRCEGYCPVSDWCRYARERGIG
jgi:hypothetical protein